MDSQPGNLAPAEQERSNSHASSSRWRHQESSDFARHAAPAAAANSARSVGPVEPQRADEETSNNELAGHIPTEAAGNAYNGEEQAAPDTRRQEHHGGEGQALEVKCGPLLNYRRMENGEWFGSVLIVTKGGGPQGESKVTPELHLKLANHVKTDATSGAAVTQYHQNGVDGSQSTNEQDEIPTNGTLTNGIQSNGTNRASGTDNLKFNGVILYSDPANTFWRFELRIPMREREVRCDYEISSLSFPDSKKKTDKQSFLIPGTPDSMRIMFHSCNGFSVGTDEEAWSGPALWNDVLRVHAKTPFHIMIGGGDQIYNDSIRVSGPLRQWTDIRIPKKRKDYGFPEKLRRDCDEFYVNNYIRWYSTEPFASANGQIPQLNIWDDHDIIDGFGSYTDDFMNCAVFRGIIGPAQKYYLLFQHHLPPPASSFTTDGPRNGVDERQTKDTYVLRDDAIDPSYITGSKPGPYVAEYSRSIYTRLGARIAFFGLDGRTERTRHQINYPETYGIIIDRLRKELAAAASSSSPISHLIVLLGIPIAYPRLSWLENIFKSPLMGPLKFLNKRFGFGGGFFNHFDGNVDLLDDLDDHYTARTHKKERLYVVHQLQALAAEFSVRVSILGGDVHLAAVGRFYSNLKLNIPIANDHRFMANIVSSAIVNKPPPPAVANLLARRNKLHHLDADTDETLMNMFDEDPGKTPKTAKSNHVTMPSRNWAMITENRGVGAASPVHNGATTNGHAQTNGDVAATNVTQMDSPPKDGHSWLHPGEVDAGTKHKAADLEQHGKGSDGSLDVSIRVEVDQHDKTGQTRGYGLTIPKLAYKDPSKSTLKEKDAVPGATYETIDKAVADKRD